MSWVLNKEQGLWVTDALTLSSVRHGLQQIKLQQRQASARATAKTGISYSYSKDRLCALGPERNDINEVTCCGRGTGAQRVLYELWVLKGMGSVKSRVAAEEQRRNGSCMSHGS